MNNQYITARFNENIRMLQMLASNARTHSWKNKWEEAKESLREAQDALHGASLNAQYLTRVQKMKNDSSFSNIGGPMICGVDILKEEVTHEL